MICPMNPDLYSVWGKDLLKRYLHRVASQTRYKFIINRFDGRLKVHNNVVDVLRGANHIDDMLFVRQGGLFGGHDDPAQFEVNARVMKRSSITGPKALYQIYGSDGERQLKKIVNGIRKELGQDG